MSDKNRSRFDDKKSYLNRLDAQPASGAVTPDPVSELPNKESINTEEIHAESNTTSKQPKVDEPDPPRTTSMGWFTAPKFGSAGSGGAELESLPKKRTNT